MKKLLPKKYRRLLWVGLLACLILYVLGSLLAPPLAGTQRKSDRQIKLPAPAAERVCLVDGNEEALLWRLRLIRSAQSEIVLSTFDFRVDESGSDVVAALLDAAERGVQVRLLVDGMNAQLHLQGSAAFQALAAHENAEVRLYNPLRLTRLWTANYRCHDKYLIIDRSAYLDTELMLLVDCPELNAVLRAEVDEMMRQGKLLLPDGTAVEGAAYTAPEMPLYKKFLQPVLRVVIRPFRYVL